MNAEIANATVTELGSWLHSTSQASHNLQQGDRIHLAIRASSQLETIESDRSFSVCKGGADSVLTTETSEAPQQSFAMSPIFRCRLAMVPLMPLCTVASVAPIIGVLSVPSDRGCETATATVESNDASGVSCFASLYSKFIEMAGRV